MGVVALHPFLTEQFRVEVLRGTTAVGVVCKDGVILATDRRVTAGFFIAHKKGRKILKIDDNIAATIAGVVADAQRIMDYAQAEAQLYKYLTRGPMSVKAAATLLSNILFSSRVFPYIMEAIIAGVDDTGPRMFTLDPFGTITEEKFISRGSGSPIALGVLESSFHEGLAMKEALPLVVKAVQMAIRRDPGSGEGFDVALVSKDGYRELTGREVEDILKGLG